MTTSLHAISIDQSSCSLVQTALLGSRISPLALITFACSAAIGGLLWVGAKLSERRKQEPLASTQLERDQARADLIAAKAIAADHERSERLIRQANEQLNHILDSTSEGVLKVDRTWNILYANRKAHQISPELQVGMHFWTCYPELLGTSAETGLHQTMDERREADYEVYYPPYDAWFSVRAFPTPLGISIFYRATTAEKKLAEQLAYERDLREKRIEALSNMAGGIAHEISNPLAIIHGTASDLQRMASENATISSLDALKATETIVKTSDRAIRILRGLRGFAREAANDPMEYASVHGIVEQAIQLQETRFSRHHVELQTTLPAELPLILCREIQIGQIITNLLNNAYDAIVEQNCVERWVSVEVRSAGGKLVLDVIDSGMGVDEEARKHLMEPFFTTKTRGVGMGVGLSLSRAIAYEHGGTLELCHGTPHTCFRLTLAGSNQAKILETESSKEVR